MRTTLPNFLLPVTEETSDAYWEQDAVERLRLHGDEDERDMLTTEVEERPACEIEKFGKLTKGTYMTADERVEAELMLNNIKEKPSR